MKILYDDQIFQLLQYGGISRYFTELAKNLQTGNSIKLPLLYSQNEYIREFKLPTIENLIPTFNSLRFRGKRRIVGNLKKLNRFIICKTLTNGNFDLFHPTYYDPYFLDHIGNRPFILTIYDMIHESFPNYFKSNDETSQWKRILASKASKIIAISENTKRDILRYYHVSDDKVVVTYLGNSLTLGNPSVEPVQLPRRYILFIGDRHIYKNFPLFMKATAPILKGDSELSIVCIGGWKFNQQEISLFRELDVEARIYQYSVSDKLLPLFYKNACCFVFPSLYEGFGIPILEAFQCGCPVIASNTSSLPEVGGDAVLYFDPYSEVELREAILKLLYNDSMKDVLIKNGYNQLNNFSWQKTAIETEKIYQSI